MFIQLNRISYYYYRMIGEHFPKVSPPSRQSLKSYNAKFVMDKCARNKYGATLSLGAKSNHYVNQDQVSTPPSALRFSLCKRELLMN